MTSIGALGGEPQTVALGATWSWGGAGRLWGMTTKGTLGTAVRFGYLGGAGAQPPAGNPGDAKWRLGTMTWGSMPGADAETTATASPTQIWGRFGFGYRGTEGDPRDGAKVGRLAVPVGRDLFAGVGWSWDYDAGVRLSEATAGRGDLLGGNEDDDPSFRYRYGKGDELQQIVDEASGKIAGLETGAYGRITKRNGIPFSYDSAGRRTEDDRFHYKWNWRGELVEVTVKDAWTEGSSPFAGHQVRYRYDAQGRLHSRSHLGPVESQGNRQLLEKRVFVWEAQSLLVEAAYGDDAESQLQWRKTYIPGPSGLDDAIQVRVENFTAPGIAGSRLYTYLRDELGTVIGVVGEEENNNPANPVIPARYLYTPYGETHIEKVLEVRRSRFEEADHKLGNQSQTVEDPANRSEGALILTFAASLDATSLAGGVVVERHNGAGWVVVPAAELLVGFEDATELKVLERQGWERGANYRIRLTTLKDKQGRGLDQVRTFEWRLAAHGSSSDFSQSYAVEYDSGKAAIDTLGARFPGGQNRLFQGLWLDPVTGISYARARWFDAGNASWLSEDPLLDVDSPNVYAFIGWKPHAGTDPLGLGEGADVRFSKPEDQIRQYRQGREKEEERQKTLPSIKVCREGLSPLRCEQISRLATRIRDERRARDNAEEPTGPRFFGLSNDEVEFLPTMDSDRSFLPDSNRIVCERKFTGCGIMPAHQRAKYKHALSDVSMEMKCVVYEDDLPIKRFEPNQGNNQNVWLSESAFGDFEFGSEGPLPPGREPLTVERSKKFKRPLPTPTNIGNPGEVLTPMGTLRTGVRFHMGGYSQACITLGYGAEGTALENYLIDFIRRNNKRGRVAFFIFDTDEPASFGKGITRNDFAPRASTLSPSLDE